MSRTAFVLLLAIAPLHAAEPSLSTGPATEKRFPPLKVPSGFKATLFACDPFIEYPSVIAIGPKPGTLFIAVDYMTGLGTDGVVKSEVRLIEDTDGDGYADKSTVYAKGFNSIEGLAYHNGTVFVMHAPFLTALRETKGTGVADERKDLLEGLGLKPEKNPVRLHCANGVVVGHDGWLYLAMGDNGTNVKRPEGDRLVLNGGGILRCRRDGRDLHIFATGTRNIYDVSLDEDLNVFFRDNENDGGTYMIRVCHSFFGADHGYPYKYYERPDEALLPIGDFGLGSSAGGVCYLETQFPKEYRGNLFNCEWGKSVVRCVPKREGSGFAQLKEIEFAAGAETDPYGFKPTDIIVDHDGSLLVSDWADGQRPKRGRGRIYRISYVDSNSQPPKKDKSRPETESYRVLLELQQVALRDGQRSVPTIRKSLEMFRNKFAFECKVFMWTLVELEQAKAIETLFDIAERDFDSGVQVQAIRAIADLTDPVLVKHKLDARQGDAKIAERLAKMARTNNPAAMLEIVVALGRLRWADSPSWLQKTLTKPDGTLAHAAMMTLRKCGNWPAVLKLLDLPDSEPMRAIALRALAEQVVPEIADGLMERLRTDKNVAHRKEYADLLSRIARQPAEWVYWGYRPPPRPANTIGWPKSEAISEALNALLADNDKSVRAFVLKRMQREKLTARLESLVAWLNDETEPDSLLVLLDALGQHPPLSIREHLEMLVADKKKPDAIRQSALKLFVSGLDETSQERLLVVAKSIEDGPVLAEALSALRRFAKLELAEFLLKKLTSPDAGVRGRAIEILALDGHLVAAETVLKLLNDKETVVRRGAAMAAGNQRLKEAAARLLTLAQDPDARVRRESLVALHRINDKRGLPLAVSALGDADTQIAAIDLISQMGGPEQSNALVDSARRNPSPRAITKIARMLHTWANGDKAKWSELETNIAQIQGTTGTLLRFEVKFAARNDVAAIIKANGAMPQTPQPQPAGFSTQFGNGLSLESAMRLGGVGKPVDGREWIAFTDLSASEQTPVQFMAGSSAPLHVFLNGKQVYKRDEAQPYRIDSDRFDATLEKGFNRILIHFPNPKSDIDFHLRFRRKSSTALHEKLTQSALSRNGNVENGRKLFLNIEKSQCLKCHRVGEQGEKIGPDLTGIGNRFSRIHLIESILEPSRTIASSFQSLAITLTDGKTVTGVKIDETDKTITFGDKDGKKHVIAKADIESQRVEKLSVMPDGLEKPLSMDEFVDLIAYMVSLKDPKPK